MQEPGTKTKYGCVVRQNSPHPSRCTRCTGCSPRLQTRPREGHGPSQGSNLGLPEEAPHPRSLPITSCQAEIVKRLSGICAQIIPFLTQEVSGPGAGQGESWKEAEGGGKGCMPQALVLLSGLRAWALAGAWASEVDGGG